MSSYTTTWLRQALAGPAAREPVTAGDGWLWRDDLRDASVLIPVLRYAEDDLRVLFTVRADHLHDHAGQISFPGGRSEPDDADAIQTALRECAEEIGAVPVEPLASLPLYTTVTGYRVTPVVGLIDGPAQLQLDRSEVASVFEVPMAHLLDPAN